MPLLDFKKTSTGKFAVCADFPVPSRFNMKSIRCPQCNFVSWANAAACKRCGNAFPSIDEADFAKPPRAAEKSPYSNYSDSATDDSYAPLPFAPDTYQNYPNNFQPPKKSNTGVIFVVMAVIGGCFAVAVVFIGIIMAIAIPNLLAARRAANEGAAIYNLRTLAQAEYTFSKTGGNCGDLSELSQANLIDHVLAAGNKSGYHFSVTKSSNGCTLNATPMQSEGIAKTGNRSFYSASWETWAIRAADKNGLPADSKDPQLNLR